jgi:hypothetical protein
VYEEESLESRFGLTGRTDGVHGLDGDRDKVRDPSPTRADTTPGTH